LGYDRAVDDLERGERALELLKTLDVQAETLAESELDTNAARREAFCPKRFDDSRRRVFLIGVDREILNPRGV
jgi:hypothetical protein